MNDTYFEIPLYNKKGLINYSKIDKDDFEKVNKNRWCISNGYAMNSGLGSLHRFIMNAKKGDIIDHISRDKLDNRKNNLRFVTYSQNAQNIQQKGVYKGVRFRNDRWFCEIRIEGKKKSFSFEQEKHAVYWYDYLATKHYGINASINGIEMPDDFVKPNDKNRSLPKGVYQKKNRFFSAIFYNKKRHYLGLYNTIEEAQTVYNEKRKEIESLKIPLEIIRNKDMIATIYTSNRDEILIDDNNYFEIAKYTWYLSSGGYAHSEIKGSNIIMHRLIMNAKTGSLVIIDHINGNRIDNRISNLRSTDSVLNAHNRIKKSGTTSKYKGVHLCKKNGKFEAKITKDKKTYFLGYFKTEREAGEAYNIKSKELYGINSKLNIIK